jgi:hypothetical protein
VPLELTDADQAEIALCCVSSLNFVERRIAEKAYRAGLAAGGTRAAQCCQALETTSPAGAGPESGAIVSACGARNRGLRSPGRTEKVSWAQGLRLV